MDSEDQQFLTDHVRDHIEAEIENYLEKEFKPEIESCFLKYQSSMNALICDFEASHKQRWKWLIFGFFCIAISNLFLIYLILTQ